VATCGILMLISCILSGGMLLTRAHKLLKKEWRADRSFSSAIARQALAPPSPPFAPQLLVQTSELPVWPPTAEKKHGAGVLLFAYGHSTTLPYFLGEAISAARSLRALNPELSIGIVSNNETVDATLFNVHLRPRSDLLFVGDVTNSGQFRSDGIARQWLTRLYYLALTPFEVTWALDSNTICCTPNSADSFMRAALATKLWGYDMVHASQRDGRLYPHNWNFVYRWTPSTSSLLREWLLLQLRRGVTADDQKTLLVAQMRLRAASIPIRLGQIATPLATAFYNVPPRRSLMRYHGMNTSGEHSPSEVRGVGQRPDDVVRFRDLEFRADGARITRMIHGPVHMLHTKDPRMCSKVNAGVQLGPADLMRSDDNGNPLGETRQLLTRFRRPAANMSDYRAMQMECEFDVGGKACEVVAIPNSTECQRTLNLAPVACPFSSDPHAKYLWWRGHTHAQNQSQPCAQSVCIPDWLRGWFGLAHPDASVQSEIPAAEERQRAQQFDAEDYQSMNAIFEPPQEPISKLHTLLDELRQHADVIESRLPKQLIQMRKQGRSVAEAA